MNGERIWMDLNVLHIPRYTLVDPHHYHHPLPWNPMNLRSNNSQIFFFLKFNGICSSELQRVPFIPLFFRVAESPLHPLLPTNFSSELQSFPLSLVTYKHKHGWFCRRSCFVWFHPEAGWHGHLPGAVEVCT